ncbi:thioredoxin family protein [Xanthocytophaga flava]|uniref:thioredoxin family protein n=1 Tax=Xanthocytophaga flava TaxID=3048013 RepID=UPI0028D27CCA|nr:thioredoxin family protein [Xanthocytophaga flavus]MDJ1466358.1 thioredoxin family protein [Xanthocytophaga flavus]
MQQVIFQQDIDHAMSYEQYKDLIDTLLSEHKTTGSNQSEGLVKYTELNRQRMRKWDKTIVLKPELVAKLQNYTTPMIWVVLTEAWCGDAAQNIPAIAKMASINPNISLRIVLRDQNPLIMDAYLTGTSRSIPKLIALKKDTLEELGTWGPRPVEVQKFVMDFKYNPDTMTQEQMYEKVHAWYANDKTQLIQQEFINLLNLWQA